MKLNTKYHGVLNYENEDILMFQKGIPGFENLKKFILVPAEENNLFYILHSIEDVNIGIVVVSPFNVLKNYEFDLNEIKVCELNIKSQKDIIVVNTVNLSTKLENITVNLKAPIIINKNENIGEQLILDNVDYPIKYPLFKGEF
ncbi:flagellar assembly protein FliW [Clostridium coskatii]|uniref:Flagellar assembly factor FliW n=1 Tax=Clostridium coskatii TaxID=1705578 RepID=A0A166TG59_9CLOT|nr:flagellar assembly protein FliW [Clostridium coskatii]OAA93648.1 Flagellar assembly factor FliW [Clostridium coskatii]OBR89990.1 flagellar assembly factor FliW [Clostridium coskatii]